MDVGRSAAQGGLADGGMLHEIVLLIHHGLCTSNEQDRIPVVQLAHLIRGQQLFAIMSSGKFKKGQALSKKAVFHSACPFLIHVFCLALFETQNYNILDGGAKWII